MDLKKRWPFVALLTLLAKVSTLASPAVAAPPLPELKAIDHGAWTQLLQRFVDERGRVDYRALAKDRAELDRYVAIVEAVGPANRPDLFPSRDHELAFYLNAYNALTWKGVVERGPEEESVWKGAISGYNFFKGMKILVAGEKTNLSDFENDVIRARYQDPRVHAALNCASIGCPTLQREAFVAEKLGAQLDAAVRQWVADPYHVALEAGSKKLRVNKIFDWFTDDFLGYEKRQGVQQPSLVGWINRYRAADQQLPTDVKLEINDYDKRINKQQAD